MKDMDLCNAALLLDDIAWVKTPVSKIKSLLESMDLEPGLYQLIAIFIATDCQLIKSKMFFDILNKFQIQTLTPKFQSQLMKLTMIHYAFDSIDMLVEVCSTE